MILSRREMNALDKGEYKTYRVPAHERVVLTRKPTQVRHKMIEDFAVRYINHLDRHGVVARDLEHITALHALFTGAFNDASN